MTPDVVRRPLDCSHETRRPPTPPPGPTRFHVHHGNHAHRTHGEPPIPQSGPATRSVRFAAPPAASLHRCWGPDAGHPARRTNRPYASGACPSPRTTWPRPPHVWGVGYGGPRPPRDGRHRSNPGSGVEWRPQREWRELPPQVLADAPHRPRAQPPDPQSRNTGTALQSAFVRHWNDHGDDSEHKPQDTHRGPTIPLSKSRDDPRHASDGSNPPNRPTPDRQPGKPLERDTPLWRGQGGMARVKSSPTKRWNSRPNNAQPTGSGMPAPSTPTRSRSASTTAIPPTSGRYRRTTTRPPMSRSNTRRTAGRRTTTPSQARPARSARMPRGGRPGPASRGIARSSAQVQAQPPWDRCVPRSE